MRSRYAQEEQPAKKDAAIVPNELAAFFESLDAHESLDLEFKRAGGNLPASIWETISAFANTNGGRLILGIDERDGQLAIEGLKDAYRMAQDLSNLLHNSQKISARICGPNDLTVESIGDHDLIVLRVPAAARRHRPVFTGANPLTGTYVRRQSGDVQCERAEVDRMTREATETSIDQQVLEFFSWDDIDQTSFSSYRQRLLLHNRRSSLNRLDDEAFMRKIGGWHRDRERERDGLTFAGLLVFG